MGVFGMEARPRRLDSKTRDRARELRRDMSPAERRLWWAIRHKSLDGARFRRQVPVGEYFADFCCLKRKLIVEVDGGQHSETEEYDRRRTQFLEAQGFRVIRFWNTDVMTNLEGVVDTIFENLNRPSRPPILTLRRNREGSIRTRS